MGFRANGYFRWCGRSCLEQNLTGYLQQVFGYLSACWPSPARQGVTADSLILSSPARAQALSRSPPAARPALIAPTTSSPTLMAMPAPSGNGFADTGTVFDLSTRSFLGR